MCKGERNTHASDGLKAAFYWFLHAFDPSGFRLRFLQPIAIRPIDTEIF
jgi:hypothetical protein